MYTLHITLLKLDETILHCVLTLHQSPRSLTPMTQSPSTNRSLVWDRHCGLQ